MDTGNSDNTNREYTSLNVERPQIDFESVGGMEQIKEQIRMKVIYPLDHAEMFAQYGKKVGFCGRRRFVNKTAPS